MRTSALVILAAAAVLPLGVNAKDKQTQDAKQVSDQVIAKQRENLAKNVDKKGFAPQSPRDIDSSSGSNPVVFAASPDASRMNLCNIHFHKFAEHKGGEFAEYAGNGDGKGFYTGYEYTGELTDAEKASVGHSVCSGEHGGLSPGDTIEAHYVYSTAEIVPGPGLGSCFNEAITNPQLRVEAQVYVLVNDEDAHNFAELAKHGQVNGYHQALNIPDDTGQHVEYAGSTTGPTYNEKGSPFQVTWNVRPDVAKVDITTVGEWCEGNAFDEEHAHGSRNLVRNPALLSEIDQNNR